MAASAQTSAVAGSPVIGLVGCGKSKAAEACPARDLYTGALFRKSLAYAEARCDVVYVVSALGGLLRLDQVVAPYEKTLAGAPRSERSQWGRRVWRQVHEQHGLGGAKGTILLLAGELYAEPLRGQATYAGWSVEEPLQGLEIGERLKFLNALAAGEIGARV